MDVMGIEKDDEKKIQNRKSEGEPGQSPLKGKKNIKKLHTQPFESFISKENKEVLIWKIKVDSGRISGLKRKKEKGKKNFVLPKI